VGKPCSIGRIGSCRTLEHFIQICYNISKNVRKKFRERDQADELACDRRRRSLPRDCGSINGYEPNS